MNIVFKDVDTLSPYENNARTHSADQVKEIANSIKEFGFNNPVLISNDNVVIAGHGRIAAAKQLGLKEVPTLCLDHLDDTQRRAYILADNRLAEKAGWDTNLLSLELEMLKDLDFNIELTGFDEDWIVKLPTEGLTDEDAVPDAPANPVTVLGDVWILGDHRLMCGDSTSIDAVETLMDGQKADMVFTDPPYNIDYQGVKDKREKIKNDKMADKDFVDFLTSSLMGCETMYVCCSWHYAHLFREAMERIARKPKAMIVWDKVNPAQHLDKYYKQHEIIFYYGDYGGHKTVRGDVWTLKRQKNTVHPTMKPVELVELALTDNPDKKVVYDGFGGSGSTLIACEKVGRSCRMMELDPKYCDVIIKRWQDFTGKQAIHSVTKEPFTGIIQA